MQTWDDNFIYLQDITGPIPRRIVDMMVVDKAGTWQLIMYSSGFSKEYVAEEELIFWEFTGSYWILVPIQLEIDTSHAFALGNLYPDMQKDIDMSLYRDGIAFPPGIQPDNTHGTYCTYRWGIMETVTENQRFRLYAVRDVEGMTKRLSSAYIEFYVGQNSPVDTENLETKETGEINIAEEPASTEPEEAQPVPLAGGFEDMDYALFLETDVGYGVTRDYFKYGIYGDFTETVQDGKNIYFLLNEKLTGNETMASSHREWYHYSGEKIVSVSSDLEWVACREFEGESGLYHEIWYRNGEAEKTFEGNIYSDMRRFVPCKTETGGYEPIPDQILDNVEAMLDELYTSFGTFGGGFDEGSRNTNYICFNDSGTLLAVRELKEKSSSDDVPERIYSLHTETGICIMK